MKKLLIVLLTVMVVGCTKKAVKDIPPDVFKIELNSSMSIRDKLDDGTKSYLEKLSRTSQIEKIAEKLVVKKDTKVTSQITELKKRTVELVAEEVVVKVGDVVNGSKVGYRSSGTVTGNQGIAISRQSKSTNQSIDISRISQEAELVKEAGSIIVMEAIFFLLIILFFVFVWICYRKGG